jgi:hypothetical protein
VQSVAARFGIRSIPTPTILKKHPDPPPLPRAHPAPPPPPGATRFTSPQGGGRSGHL